MKSKQPINNKKRKEVEKDFGKAKKTLKKIKRPVKKAKRGRPFGTKAIESPEKMWGLFLAYKKQVKDNPFIVKDWTGKDSIEVNREKEKPLTMEGFECYCMNMGIIGDLHHYFSNLNKSYGLYLPVCSRIKKEIRNEQISGGMAGIYNPSITQRLNSLTDKTETIVREQRLLSDDDDDNE